MIVARSKLRNRYDGHVYFVRSPTTGQVKIGFTSGPIAVRLRGLSCGHGANLKLLRLIEGDRALERSFHERFKAYRQVGEWFAPAPEVLHEAGALAEVPRGFFFPVVRLGETEPATVSGTGVPLRDDGYPIPIPK